jgi:hypothetical protein
MSDKSKKDKERERLKEEFDRIQFESNDTYDLSEHLADLGDLPDLGSIETYDYDSDIESSIKKSTEVIESLVDLYFSDLPSLKKHSYIKNKIKEDASVYAETIFLSKMTRKNFITMLKQIDNGDNSARMYEVVNQTITQIRENAKFSSNQRNELEKFYKSLRDDVDEYDLKGVVTEKEETKNPKKKSEPIPTDIVDNRSMNDMIKQALEGKNFKD